MVEYPYIVLEEDKKIMFYNGNGFGKTGIGYAVSENPIWKSENYFKWKFFRRKNLKSEKRCTVYFWKGFHEF